MSGVAAMPELGDAELAQLRDFLYRRTGIAYGSEKRYYLRRRLAQGMERSGSTGVSGYLALLRAGTAETELFINSITINETYFYREQHQFQCLGRSLLPEIVARRGPGDLVRLWSMPCSTGEEAYSLAIWLLENWPLVDAYHIEIVGSDLDTGALAEALAAEYGERSLHRLPPELLARYFEPPRNGRRRLIHDLRDSVRFTSTNLVDEVGMASQGRFDVVFCRNVLIYFDDASRAVAATNLYQALQPGGFLCLGHSESMARISDRFRQRRFEDAIVYQRPHPA